jgi:transcriptional regulator with XRE-family HTH domain
MNNEEVGDRLLLFRQGVKLSQAEFAERLGASPGAYKNYERGEREIPSSLLWSLHREFDVDPLWVLAGESNIDRKLLTAIGMAVENVMEQQGIPLTSAKKWQIISFAYGQCTRDKKPDQALISTLVSVGGN